MTNYICMRCGYKTKSKYTLKRHLNRKFICSPILSNTSINSIKECYNIKIAPQNSLPISSQIEGTVSQNSLPLPSQIKKIS